MLRRLIVVVILSRSAASLRDDDDLSLLRSRPFLLATMLVIASTRQGVQFALGGGDLPEFLTVIDGEILLRHVLSQFPATGKQVLLGGDEGRRNAVG